MNKRGIYLILLATILIPFGQILFKLGANRIDFTLMNLVTNYYLIFGFILYALSAVLITFGLRGGELSVLYPLIATSFIWVLVLSSLFLKEDINALKIVGMIAIIAGISSIGMGAKR